MSSDVPTCPLCEKRPRRKHGVECRQCYKRLWQARNRKKEKELQKLSLDESSHLLDQIAYREWFYEQ